MKKYKLKSNIIYRKSDMLVFDTEKSILLNLNESSNDILNFLTDWVSVVDLVDTLKNKYIDSIKQDIEKNVLYFIELLNKTGSYLDEIDV